MWFWNSSATSEEVAGAIDAGGIMISNFCFDSRNKGLEVWNLDEL
jgi:hypothetical protein